MSYPIEYKQSDIPRFEAKYVIDDSGCWLWTAALNTKGYGAFSLGGRSRRPVMAHRLAWVIKNGPILNELVIDHLCRVRNCVNTNHMELVTAGENTRRGLGNRYKERTHCIKGHEFTEDNIYVNSSRPNARVCIKCNNRRNREYHQRLRDKKQIIT